VAATLRKIQANPRLAGYRVGENTALVDRTYAANAAHAALLAADRLNPAHPQHATTVGNVFFIADGEPRPYWDYDIERRADRRTEKNGGKGPKENDKPKTTHAFVSCLPKLLSPQLACTVLSVE
jgi:hypothetical protein